MMIFNSLVILAAAFFIAHVVLLFTSFGKDGHQKRKYFYSHFTLWICGVILFILASLYAGKGVSPLLDVFDTPLKRGLIIGVVLLLSFVAHNVVRLMILPKYSVNKN